MTFDGDPSKRRRRIRASHNSGEGEEVTDSEMSKGWNQQAWTILGA